MLGTILGSQSTPVARLTLILCLAVLTAFVSWGSVQHVGAQEAITLTASPSTVSPGDDLTISWTVPENQVADLDWIGFYAVGASNENYEVWDEFPWYCQWRLDCPIAAECADWAV